MISTDLLISKPICMRKLLGEYANPSFESQVETVGKGRTQGIMSIEAAVDELYGDTKDDDWKSTEVQRIKAQTGVETMSEPLLFTD